MPYNGSGLTIGRGGPFDQTTENNIATHTYKNLDDSAAVITAANYFPPFLGNGGGPDTVITTDVLEVIDSSLQIITYQLIVNSDTGQVTLIAPSTADGDVVGPGSSTANAIARYADTTGRLIKDSVITIDDSGVLTTPSVLSCVGLIAVAIDVAFASGNQLQIGINNATQIRMGNSGIPVNIQGNATVGSGGSGNLIVNGTVTASEYIQSAIVLTSSGTLATNVRYLSNGAGLLSLTLPTTANVGDIIDVTGMGAGLFQILQNTGQICHFGNVNTTLSTGSLVSTQQYDSIRLICSVANTDFIVMSSQGNFTVN